MKVGIIDGQILEGSSLMVTLYHIMNKGKRSKSQRMLRTSESLIRVFPFGFQLIALLVFTEASGPLIIHMTPLLLG